MELTRKAGITVLLDGAGGDEAFLGYHFALYPSDLLHALSRGTPARRRHKSSAWRRRRNGVSLRRAASEALRLCVAPPGSRAPEAILDQPEAADSAPTTSAADALGPSALRADSVAAADAQPSRTTATPWASRSRSGTPSSTTGSSSTALALDSRDLLQQGLSKWVLREAMRDILPSAIVERPDKQGFTTDEVDWLRRGELGSEIEAAFRSKSFAARPYFRPDALLTMLAVSPRRSAARVRPLARV